MQNPVKEIEEVVRGLVEKPTLKRQAAVLDKYFTQDVEFYHFYINTKGGVKDLTAIYQMAELIVNYQSVEFENIVYDRKENALVLRMTVYVRPFRVFPLTALKFLTLLQLQDHHHQVSTHLLLSLHNINHHYEWFNIFFS